MAPTAAGLAVTFAAMLAAGMGVALARTERERRLSRRRHAAARQFALLPAEQPAQGLPRIALGQLDLAIELLGGDGGLPPDAQAVHETRKALKRLRALVRMLAQQLGDQELARENAALRDSGRRLAAARDAEVMMGTLDALCARYPRKLAGRPGIAEVREGLLAEREAATARTVGQPALRAQVRGELQAIRGRVAGWRMRDGRGLALVEPGLERIYRAGRARYRRAAAARGPRERGRALHEWRKRVKDLRYALEMLAREDPAPAWPRRARGRTGGARQARPDERLRVLARRADELGETLGEEHDLALLSARIEGRGSERPPLDDRTRAVALALIARRRRKLRVRALRAGASLYRRKPRRFLRRVRRAYRAQK